MVKKLAPGKRREPEVVRKGTNSNRMKRKCPYYIIIRRALVPLVLPVPLVLIPSSH